MKNGVPSVNSIKIIMKVRFKCFFKLNTIENYLIIEILICLVPDKVKIGYYPKISLKNHFFLYNAL